MTTLRPRTPCTIRRWTGGYDRQGRRVHEETGKTTKCAVVWVKDGVDETSVRADSSASRGRAEERVFDVRLLFLPREVVRTGDLVSVQVAANFEALQVEVGLAQPRPDVEGVVHHIQVEGNRWASA